MSVTQLVNPQNLSCLDIEQVPIETFQNFNSPHHIAMHMKSMLEQYGSSSPKSLKLPSIFDLSAFYNRKLSVILEALFELQTEQYDYIMHSMDEEFILFDPLDRKNDFNVFSIH